MLKTIRGRMALLQGLMIFFILGIIFVIFVSCGEDYYFGRKIEVIKSAFEKLSEKDIASIRDGDSDIIFYEEQQIQFIIADEKFKPIYVSNRGNGKSSLADSKRAGYKINKSIVTKLNQYNEKKITTKNGKRRISGKGIILQNGHKYYVYMYELKTAMKIYLSYATIFFVIIVFMVSVIGIVVSMIISYKISRPIKQIELDTRAAIKNNYDIVIAEKQEFKELTGLAQSINAMTAKIRNQIGILENELERKEHDEKLRKQFVNNVSHEMKTPLAVISAQVEMIQYLSDEDKRQEYCDSIMEEVENMSEMINDMISIFSIQNNEQTLVTDDVDISELVETLCNEYDKLFESKKITVKKKFELNANACVNEKLIRQAISNYISNAIKHSTQNSEITVRVLSLEHTVKVEVENQGEHINEILKDKIWNIFYSGDDETLNGQKSSGLGLYIVKCVAGLHGADCGFENTESGVRFYIVLNKVQK